MSTAATDAVPNPGEVFANLTVPALVEQAIRRGEAELAANGALVAYTGKHTGRSPKDRFIVAHGEAEQRVDWGGFNQPVKPDVFDRLWKKAQDHHAGKDIFVVDGYVGADPDHQIKVRVVAQFAWHAIFVKQLFRRPSPDELENFEPDFTLLSAPTLEADPETDGTRSNTFVSLDLERRRVLIVGTQYAGEMKKSIFSAANFLFPMKGVLTMHCSANVGEDETVALFFGLSGTGKTTLSTDEGRALIGDDEHGWSDSGVFNLEGGCYAKCIDLSPEKEPQIYSAIRFGSMLENVELDDRRAPIYSSNKFTENTRAVYPIEYIPGHDDDGRAGHAKTVVFLTADAFGVLPPVSLLSKEAAMYHFLSGFTSKLAGTEVGLGSEPEATFSTCFGAPFLPLPAVVYAQMLKERIGKHGSKVFLINTGWTGGPFGVGQRMALPATRAIVRAAISGQLDDVPTKRHEIFNLEMPVTCPGVADEVLDPALTWDDPAKYEAQARDLAARFHKNFDRFAAIVSPEVKAAGPVPL